MNRSTFCFLIIFFINISLFGIGIFFIVHYCLSSEARKPSVVPFLVLGSIFIGIFILYLCYILEMMIKKIKVNNRVDVDREDNVTISPINSLATSLQIQDSFFYSRRDTRLDIHDFLEEDFSDELAFSHSFTQSNSTKILLNSNGFGETFEFTAPTFVIDRSSPLQMKRGSFVDEEERILNLFKVKDLNRPRSA